MRVVEPVGQGLRVSSETVEDTRSDATGTKGEEHPGARGKAQLAERFDLRIRAGIEQ